MTPAYLPDDPAAAVAVLQEAFPGVPIWFGGFTRHYWAHVGDRLVEADHPAQPAHVLDDLTSSQPRRPRDGRMVHAPSPGAGPYGPMMAAVARQVPSQGTLRDSYRTAATSPARRTARWRPPRHRIDSWIPAHAW